VWTDHLVEPGERDVPPRERVRGVTADWPTYPSGQQLRVSWDLEPRLPVQDGEPHLKKPA